MQPINIKNFVALTLIGGFTGGAMSLHAQSQIIQQRAKEAREKTESRNAAVKPTTATNVTYKARQYTGPASTTNDAYQARQFSRPASTSDAYKTRQYSRPASTTNDTYKARQYRRSASSTNLTVQARPPSTPIAPARPQAPQR